MNPLPYQNTSTLSMVLLITNTRKRRSSMSTWSIGKIIRKYSLGTISRRKKSSFWRRIRINLHLFRSWNLKEINLHCRLEKSRRSSLKIRIIIRKYKGKTRSWSFDWARRNGNITSHLSWLNTSATRNTTGIARPGRPS